jgi:hypothetical protein
VTATFRRQLLHSLRVGGGPAVFSIRGEGSEATVRRLSLDIAWRIARGLSLDASHQLSLQQGGLGLLGPPREITHNTLLLRLVATSAGR